MAALAELNRPPPTRPSHAKAAFQPQDDDEDWEAQIALAEQEAQQDSWHGGHGDEDVDMDVLREIEAQERAQRGEDDGKKAAKGNRGGEGRENAPFGTTNVGGTTKGAGKTNDAKGKGKMVFEEDEDFGSFPEESVGAFSLPFPPFFFSITNA